MHAVVLGFDFGLRHIGVAVGQSITGSATALDTLTPVNQQPDWQTIAKLIDTWQPTHLVVGDPLTMDGLPTDATHGARQFARQLQHRYPQTVSLQDERMSSIEASDVIRQQRRSGERKRRQKKGDIDEIAAAIIVQRWLTENSFN